MKSFSIIKVVNNNLKLIILVTLLSCLLLPLAYSRESRLYDVKDYSLAEGAVGAIFIASPTMGSLFHLRGIVGKGFLVSRQNSRINCFASPLKIAAGDFAGRTISVSSTEPIRLNIYSQDIIEKLNAGIEIISKDYTIVNRAEGGLGDIQIVTGLNLSHGFVLNPSEWSLATIFDENKKEVGCLAV